jgi:hypothetical protein
VIDIAGGGSFYKRNKSHFTRAEAHHFLGTGMNYTGPVSLFWAVNKTVSGTG